MVAAAVMVAVEREQVVAVMVVGVRVGRVAARAGCDTQVGGEVRWVAVAKEVEATQVSGVVARETVVAVRAQGAGARGTVAAVRAQEVVAKAAAVVVRE